MPAKNRAQVREALVEFPDLGPALPHNMGAARVVPDDIAKVMADVVLANPAIAYLVTKFIQESGMAGPEGGEVKIELHMRPELHVVGSTLDGLTEKPATNGHRKRS